MPGSKVTTADAEGPDSPGAPDAYQDSAGAGAPAPMPDANELPGATCPAAQVVRFNSLPLCAPRELPSHRDVPEIPGQVLDTDDPTMCTPMTGDGADKVCFVMAQDSLTVKSTLRATGRRPPVLAASTIDVQALLDVGSHRGKVPEIGAGADPDVCLLAGGSLPSAHGGGAGGSFVTSGGAGGGDVAGDTGGKPGAGVLPDSLRGGCAGQASDAGSGAGHGGGAVYLSARVSIVLTGEINAAGESGDGGPVGDSGGGAGAGGMVVFDAPMVTGPGSVIATGGGGGGGGGDTTPDRQGKEPVTSSPARGGTAGAHGGDGGDGATTSAAAAGGGRPGSSGGGGGGGGGGAGFIRAPGNAELGGTVTPPPMP